MGTALEGSGLVNDDYGSAPGCSEILNKTKPDTVAAIHRSFLEAGSIAVEANSFGGTAIKLAEWGLAGEARDLNQRAAAIALQAVRAVNPGGIVVGSLGPSGELPTSPDYEGCGAAAITDAFALQAEALVAGGAGVLLVETSQDLLEVRCALRGCRRAMKSAGREVPLWCSVSLHQGGRMLMGTAVDGALAVARSLGVDAFGLNCATGPEEMIDAVRYLSSHSPLPIIVSPNAGVPENVEGKPVFPLGSGAFAEAMTPFLRMGVEIVGGCCGATPEHINALKGVLGEYAPRKKPAARFMLASAVSAQEMKPEGSPLIVGERLNSQGSRKFRKLLLKEKWEKTIDVARHQEEAGAQVLDLSVALTERATEKEDMVRLVKTFSTAVPLPLMIDTVDPAVVEGALEHFPGVAVLNSINLERPSKCRRLLSIVAEHGAAVVALTIDEKGMAKTLEEKLDVAGRLYSLAVDQYGIDPGAVLFDPLTFTLATGEEDLRGSAAATLDAIRELRSKYPESGIILGVSNVSFGLPPAVRKVINAVFLHRAVRAGLTAAIVNPADIVGYSDIPEEKLALAEDLIFDRRDDALERVVEELGGLGKEESGSGEGAPALEPEEELARAVLERRPSGLEKVLEKCLAKHSAQDLVNDILLPAMKEVGDRMARGETILPHVLRSAEVMRKALTVLAPRLGKSGGALGKVVLATVFGDVHDIGKNLVKAIFSNNGFEVVDLGKQVPAHDIIEAVERENPLALGLSAMLVSTSAEMGACVEALHEKGIALPVIVGGAAVSPAFAKRIAIVNKKEYPGGVYYAVDAFSGLDHCRRLSGAGSAPVAKALKKKKTKKSKTVKKARQKETEEEPPPAEPFEAPFRGTRIAEIAADAVYGHVGEEEGADLFRPPSEILEEMEKELGKRELIAPAAVYGYFPCRRDGDALVVDGEGKAYTFSFPPRRKKASLASWFREKDLFIPYLATIGSESIEAYQELESRGKIALSQEWAAFCALLAEATAVEMRLQIAAQLGFSMKKPVLGFSPGYPLWRSLPDQVPLLKLLGGERVHVTLTERFQLVPEFSTTGIVVPNEAVTY